MFNRISLFTRAASSIPMLSKQPEQSHPNRDHVLHMSDFYTLLRPHLTSRDYGNLECVSKKICDASRTSVEAQRLQLAAWFRIPASTLPVWLQFVSPYTVIKALVAQSPRGLHPDAYLGCLLQRLPQSAFKLSGMKVETAQTLLSDSRLHCGERTVSELVEALINNEQLTEAAKAQLRACIRDGSASSPFRSLGDQAEVRPLRSIALTGHTQWVTSAVVLPDGRLVTTSSDGTARVWTERDGSWNSVVLRHMHSATHATVLPDGRIVTRSGDNIAQVWTERNGSWNSVVLRGHTNSVTSATALADGRIVTTSLDHTARVWTERDGSWDSVVLRGHTSAVWSATALTDGRPVTTSFDGTARVWTQRNGNWHSVDLRGHVNSVTSATVLVDGRLVTSSDLGTARAWIEQPNGSWNSVVLSGLTDPVRRATVLANGRLVTTSNDHTARVWTEQLNGSWNSVVLSGHATLVTSATVLADGRLVTTSYDSTARIWSV